jgi:hypothetical protein
MNGDGTMGFVCWTVVCLIVGGVIGGCIKEDHIYGQAIYAGVAEHYIDELQNKAFRWKTNRVTYLMQTKNGLVEWPQEWLSVTNSELLRRAYE